MKAGRHANLAPCSCPCRSPRSVAHHARSDTLDDVLVEYCSLGAARARIKFHEILGEFVAYHYSLSPEMREKSSSEPVIKTAFDLVLKVAGVLKAAESVAHLPKGWEKQFRKSQLCHSLVDKLQLLIYHGPESRKPLVAIAEVKWKRATLGVGTIELKSDAADNELVYECVGLAFKHCSGVKNPSKDIPVNATTFSRMVN